jgi:hypothetical protein
MRARNIEDWLTMVRRIPSHDEDCVILFTGVERSGKSNTAQVLLRRIDPSFGVHRIAWDNAAFFEIVRDLPKGRAVLHDEAKINSRRAMSKGTLDLLDWLQVCGGLNHFIGLCFPRVHRTDAAVAERVRFNVHQVARGRAVIRTWTGNDDQPWREHFSFDVEQLPEDRRTPYLRAKEAAARAALDRVEREKSGGADQAGLDAELVSVARRKMNPDSRRL